MRCLSFPAKNGGAPKERRRCRAEKRLSKRVFWESPLLLCSLKGFQDLSGVLRANLKGAEKKRTLQILKHPFGQPFLRTTPSPLLWRALKERGVTGIQQWRNLIIPKKGPIHISPVKRFINPMRAPDSL